MKCSLSQIIPTSLGIYLKGTSFWFFSFSTQMFVTEEMLLRGLKLSLCPWSYPTITSTRNDGNTTQMEENHRWSHTTSPSSHCGEEGGDALSVSRFLIKHYLPIVRRLGLSFQARKWEDMLGWLPSRIRLWCCVAYIF